MRIESNREDGRNSDEQPVKDDAVAMVRDEEGLSTVEYVIILVLVAVMGIGVWSAFGDAVSKQIKTSTEEVEAM